MQKKSKSGLVLCFIGALILAVGLVVTTYGVLAFIGNMADTSTPQKFKAPGKTTLTVEEPARIMIYHEWKSSPGKDQYTGFNPDILTFSVLDQGGKEVLVNKARSTETYKIGDLNGVSKWEFDASTVGEYTVTTQVPQDIQAEFNLSMGPSLLKEGMTSLLTSILAIVVGGIADTIGMVLVIIGLLMRLKSKPNLPGDVTS